MIPQAERLLSMLFRAAAVYNIAWGTVVVLFPNLLFELFHLPPINYPFVMRGLGMCIGFLGKALGPIGWYWTVVTTGRRARSA